MKVKETTTSQRQNGIDFLMSRQLDIAAPKHPVEIELDTTRRILYVHIDGLTVLRVGHADFRLLVNGQDFGAPADPRTTTQ